MDIKQIEISGTVYDIKDPTKQPIISDLDEIRSKSESALQPEDLSAEDNITYSNKVIGVASGYEIPTTTQVGKIATNETAIATIQSLIPEQATSSNQLADKSFVNSTVGTNTSNYISNNGQPFTSLAQLQAYTGTVTNNDYAFITGTDEEGNTFYDRYKATVTGTTVSWAKEYRLNNSSFTASQWASIESGITSGDVALIRTALQSGDNVSELTNDVGYVTSAYHDSTKQDNLVSGTNIKNINGSSVLGGGNISVATTEQGAKADTALQPSALNPYRTSSAQDVIDATKQDVATALNYNNISNCITYIPQDIKLELNNGTLTLKAGSKVYYPNGSGVFSSVTTSSDLTATRTDSQDCIVWLNYSFTPMSIQVFPISLVYSGPTAPTGIGTFAFWYDTTNNKCKVTSDSGSTWAEYKSFPLCVVSTDGTKISAIKQVFNGFGYIGSTVFALPGVKGLIPDGRNADGSLKNTKFTVSNILTRTITAGSGGITRFWINATQANLVASIPGYFYEESENKIYNASIAPGNERRYCFICNVIYDASHKITSFDKKTIFHALDYNDKGTISGWGMPSSRYIDLTLGASGGEYTAPSNGWFIINKATTGTNQFIEMLNNSTGFNTVDQPYAVGAAKLFIPCTANAKIRVTYTAGGDLRWFRFVYAEGEI